MQTLAHAPHPVHLSRDASVGSVFMLLITKDEVFEFMQKEGNQMLIPTIKIGILVNLLVMLSNFFADNKIKKGGVG